MKKIQYPLLFLLIGLLSACGKTMLTSAFPEAEIKINGIYKGKGTVYIPQIGPPRRLRVEAEYHGKTIGSVKISRSFTGITLVSGCLTYGVGYLVTWEFPKTVEIPLNNPESLGNFLKPAAKDTTNVWENKTSTW